MRSPLLILFFLVAPQLTLAQWSDDFSDGDFFNNPTWIGSTALWQVVPFDGRLILNSNGLAHSDTLHLAAASDVAYGSWRFQFAYQDVNLSNFNGTRVFLVADTTDLTGHVRGYYLQFGTNNTNQVRLYRIDGDPAQRRREIGRSEEALLEATSGVLGVEVRRSPDDVWEVWIDDVLQITAVDGEYRHSSYFGFWVKHTAAAAQGYFFGNVEVEPGDAPAPEPLWIEMVKVISATAIDVTYSRPVQTADACRSQSYRINDEPAVANVTCDEGDAVRKVRLHLAQRLEVGTYTFSVAAIRDQAGDVHEAITYDFDVDPDDVRPFEPVRAVYDIRQPHVIVIEMTHSLMEDSLANVKVEIVPLSHVTLTEAGDEPNELLIHLDAPLTTGTYTISLRRLASIHGATFEGSISRKVARRPEPLDIVINEIHFAPLDQQVEFIELYNRSTYDVDLAHLDFADDRLQRARVAVTSISIAPGSYAVLVRDSVAFAEVFPGIALHQPPLWHTLNNSGDAVHLFAGATVIDSVTFTASWGSGSASIERVDPDGPSIRHNFGPSTDDAGATPGRVNSIFSQDRPQVVLIAAEEVGSSRVTVVMSGAISNASARPEAFRLDGREALSVTQDEANVLHVDHDVERPREVQINGLRDVFGEAIPESTTEIAARPQEAEIAVSEVMYDPRADPDDGLPDQPEYVEIVNVSDRRLSLSRLAIADAFDENGVSRYIMHTEAYPSIPSGGYAVLSAEPGDPMSDEPRIRLAFAEMDADALVLRVRRATLSFPLRGRLLRLVDLTDADEVTELDRVHYDPEWHHAAVRDARGRSLERIDLMAGANDPINWSTSVSPSGGTPGSINSLSSSPTDPSGDAGLTIEPSVFSPDDDGIDDLAHIRFRLRAPSSVVRARIFDSRGRLVRNLEPSAFAGSEGSLTWDGYDDQRRRLPIGIYIILLDSTDVEGGTTEAYKSVVVLARPLG